MPGVQYPHCKACVSWNADCMGCHFPFSARPCTVVISRPSACTAKTVHHLTDSPFISTVHAGLRVARLGNSSVRYEVGLFRNDEGVAAAQGHFVHVYVDRETRRPATLPAEMRGALERIRA